MCRSNSKPTGGFIVLIIGAVFLLRNLGIIQQPLWSIIWPSILIAIGIGILCGESCVKIARKKKE